MVKNITSRFPVTNVTSLIHNTRKNMKNCTPERFDENAVVDRNMK